MHRCPFCAEEIDASDITCRWCGEALGVRGGGVDRPQEFVYRAAEFLRTRRGTYTIVALLASALILPSIVGGSSRAEVTPVPEITFDAVAQGLAVLETSASLVNDQYSGTFAMYNQRLGRGRCWAGFSADFNRPLITVIWPTGNWYQFLPDPMTPGGINATQVRLGSDYRQAGIDPVEFDASNVLCEIGDDGAIYFPARNGS